ncbi:polypeptide N-acetylgalactosaminyltransferase 5-like [Haliotis rubra]|uniref:polypeptide N-acetylgalactosaminyltransferase 5-like n=1 Tax=Haliotis rubra TaxID=36100 RepID=UPI001EE537A1|nr:polypeptide N-acetylgalactosaminyltransferase 5-like [Haliotis rubra]
MTSLVLHFIIKMKLHQMQLIHAVVVCLMVVCIYTTNILLQAAVNNLFHDTGYFALKTEKGGSAANQNSHQEEVYMMVRNNLKREPPDNETEQSEQLKHSIHGVEYFVEEYGEEDSKETNPPFVEYSPGNGPGEWGIAFNYKHTASEELQYMDGIKRNGFNQLVSDRISVHRRLLDNRLEECKSREYPADLPPASVIICFHNEAWSTLLRSVHSVLDRSPEHLIREIILVDDASTQDYLKTPLRNYMSKLEKVKILRHRKHQGLIRARLTGYEVAVGPTLVFLDSHIECFPGWLEPLLNRIRENPRNVPFPNIDVISSKSFGTGKSGKTEQFGVFRWKMLQFNWGNLSNERKSKLKSPADPIRSPTMPGGLFAIDKQWFTTLGTYDPGLLYWGGENMELSFKVWMCNGTLEILPCSHVGHVFRMRNPVRWEGPGKPVVTNSMRVAEVWLDEYKYLFYEQTSLMRGSRFGDVTDRKKLRDSLQCHDFRWYIENIYPECRILTVLNSGEVRSYSSPTMCLSAASNRTPSLCSCESPVRTKYWRLLPSGVLQDSNLQILCVMEGQLIHHECYTSKLHIWTYTEDSNLYLKTFDKCLTVGDNSSVHMATCDGRINQKWMFEKSKFHDNV